MLPLLPCFKVLPLVYDESLSYYEVLCKLTKLIQEMAKNVDGNFNSIQNEIEKIYSQITDLKAYVDEQDSKLSNRIDLTNERITEEIRKCHEHCEIYAKRLYDQLLNILNQYQGEMKQWVLGEIAKIPTGIPKQFAITGNPETSGLQHDIITVTRESMCDFVNSDKYTCEQIDDIGIPIKFYENTNICYDYDTKCFYDLIHKGVNDIQTDAPSIFYFSISRAFYTGNELIIKGNAISVSVKINGDKFNFTFTFEDETENEILEIPITNLNIVIALNGRIALFDICKEQFSKVNFFNNDLPYEGDIGEITEIKIINNTKEEIYKDFIPFLPTNFY
jgi:hypothetical protein